MDKSMQNSSTKRSISTQIEELKKRKNDMFDFKSETEDLDDLADEIFEALATHTASQHENNPKDN